MILLSYFAAPIYDCRRGENGNAGVVSTIMAMPPVFLIAPAILVFKEKVTLRDVIGAIIAVGGVALFFLR